MKDEVAELVRDREPMPRSSVIGVHRYDAVLAEPVDAAKRGTAGRTGRLRAFPVRLFQSTSNF